MRSSEPFLGILVQCEVVNLPKKVRCDTTYLVESPRDGELGAALTIGCRGLLGNGLPSSSRGAPAIGCCCRCAKPIETVGCAARVLDSDQVGDSLPGEPAATGVFQGREFLAVQGFA
ncbi:hypothetical protein CIB93_05205 [Streptomyces sp. WZ.A104]|nr:hypothetical protein CIB93_05205 [Streptomyces sp. WZ.A104]